MLPCKVRKAGWEIQGWLAAHPVPYQARKQLDPNEIVLLTTPLII